MSKIVIVGFDGLQPAQISKSLTPNVHKFSTQGCFFEDHHCVFPSVTRVNIASLMTGMHPGGHGLLGNNFIDTTYDPTRVIPASNIEFDHMKQSKHRILYAETMYEILQKFNMNYMAIGVGTTGNAYIHHLGNEDATFNSGTIHPEFTNPPHLSEEIATRFEKWPIEEVPNNRRFSLAMDIFTEYVLKEKNPEVALIWSSEPDKSQHAYGVGHEISESALKHADKEFGRLLEDLGPNFTDENTVMIVSDHGYSTISDVIGLEDVFLSSGFSLGPDRGELLIALNGGSVLISIGESDKTVADNLVSWLMAQPWCGTILTGDRVGPLEGTISLSDIGLEGSRSPDIVFSFRWDSRPNEFNYHGFVGASSGGVNLGMHGSMSPHEMNNVLICKGPKFSENKRVLTPSGNIDVLPTILDNLGIEVPESINGRVLKEAYKNAQNEVVFNRRSLRSEREIEGFSFKQEILLSELDGSMYIDEGSSVLE